MPENAHLEYLSIRLDEGGTRVIAYFAPAGDVDSITLGDFKQAVNAAGFGEYDLDEAALRDATAQYAAGRAFELALGDAVDGEFDIRIDIGHLNAYLTCIPPRGGAPVTLERVLEEAKHKEITVGIDLEAIEQALKEGGNNVLIASGKAATDGRVRDDDGRDRERVQGIVRGCGDCGVRGAELKSACDDGGRGAGGRGA